MVVGSQEEEVVGSMIEEMIDFQEEEVVGETDGENICFCWTIPGLWWNMVMSKGHISFMIMKKIYHSSICIRAIFGA